MSSHAKSDDEPRDAGDSAPAPVTPVTPVTHDIWHVRAPALKLPGGVQMPIASTLLRLPDRTLVLYSPVPLDDTTATAIEALGEVAHIVAPSLWHHLYVTAAAERFPRAMIHGAPGLAA